MQDQLIIYLHAHDLTNPTWATATYTHHGETESLADAAIDREVIVVVPAEDVLLLSATFPKMNRTRLLQALPFAFEEQLIAELDTLHFAPGKVVEHQPLPVCVVAHEKMQSWLSLLATWHIQADKILPATFALPVEANTWSVMLSDMATIRTGIYSGFGCDLENCLTLLSMALSSSEMPPTEIRVQNYSSQSFSSTSILPIPLKEVLLPKEQFMMDVRACVLTTPAINLLQGSYAVKKAKLPQLKSGLKIAAYLAAAWVFLLFFSPVVSYFILEHQASHYEKQIAEIYYHNFPQASNLIAPKLRMQEKLQKLQAQVGENHLLLLMAYVGKGMAQNASIKLNRIDFQNNQLTLELSAATSEDFSNFTDFLTQQGLNVKQQNADLVGARVNATLQIE